MLRYFWTVLCFVLPLNPGIVLGSSPEDDLRTWLETLTSLEAPPDLTGMRVRWKVVQLAALSEAEADQIRKSVAGRPDHPDRVRLERDDRVRAGKGWMERELWMRGENEYRLGSSAPDTRGDLQVVDDVRRDDISWTLVDIRSLTLRVPDRLDPDDRNLKGVSRAAQHELQTLLSGGLWQVGAKGTQPAIARIDGDRWTAEWKLDRGGRLVAHGRWAADNQGRSIERVRHDWTGESGPVWFEFTNGPWLTIHETGLRLAAWVEERSSQKRLDRRIEFTEIAKESRATFDQLTEPPATQGIDPIRGAIALIRVTDRTGNEAIFRRYFPDGSVKEVRASESVEATSQVSLRWLGWGLLGVLAVAIVFLRIAKRRHA